MTVSDRILSRTTLLRLTPLVTMSKADRAALEDEGERLGRFVERNAARHEVVWTRD